MLYLVLVLLTRNGTNNFSCLLHLDVLNNINRVCRGVPTVSTERDSERTQNSSDSLCRATSPIKGGNDGWSRSSVTKVTGWVQSQALTKRHRLYRQKRDPRPHSQVQGQAEHGNKEKLDFKFTAAKQNCCK